MRTFFREKIPADIRRKGAEGHHATPEEMIQCQRIMNQHGLATPNWPVEWGGKDWSPMQRYIYTEEILAHDVPAPLPFNVHMVGPVIAYLRDRGAEEAFPAAHCEHRRLVVPGVFPNRAPDRTWRT